MTHWTDRHVLVPAVYIIIERNKQYLMLRRFNASYKNGHYTFPAGHMDGNEAPSQAAAREASEEAGVLIDPSDLEMMHCMVYKAEEGGHERVSLFFVAKVFSGEPKNMEPEKCDDMQWFDIDNLPNNLVPEVRHALEQIAGGQVYSEIY